ncbi:hypothetical protein [Crocosphaera sp. Alani8]|uniref:hypothetical protein n=1 Tax=Crocosphaera sp. Alani8 TaxID=3038952 RepID=UPI00313C4804
MIHALGTLNDFLGTTKIPVGILPPENSPEFNEFLEKIIVVDYDNFFDDELNFSFTVWLAIEGQLSVNLFGINGFNLLIGNQVEEYILISATFNVDDGEPTLTLYDVALTLSLQNPNDSGEKIAEIRLQGTLEINQSLEIQTSNILVEIDAPAIFNDEVLEIKDFYFDQDCLAIRWEDENVNRWLQSAISNSNQLGGNIPGDMTLRILFGAPIQEIRLDWEVTDSLTFALSSFEIEFPENLTYSLLLNSRSNDSNIERLSLILTLGENQELTASSNFAWTRNENTERELQNDDNSSEEKLWKLSAITQQEISLVLISLQLDEFQLPEFFRQLENPLISFDFSNISELKEPSSSDFVSLNGDSWEKIDLTINKELDFPFLKQGSDQFIKIKPKDADGTTGKLTINAEVDQDNKFNNIAIPFDVIVEIFDLNFTTEVELKFNWETFALSVEHSKGIEFISDQEELPTSGNEYLGLTWKLTGARINEGENEGKFHFFTLITDNFNYQLQQAPGSVLTLEYSSIGKEALVFESRNFTLTESGISLEAEVTNQPVRLNGLDTKFTFRNSRFEIKDNNIRNFTLKGSGALPPALVGEAEADIALQFAQQNGSLTLVSGSAQLKGKKPLFSTGTRFQFNIDALGLKFVNDARYHLYFTLTGSAQFVAMPGDKDGALALLSVIKIDLVECPLTGDASIISQHVKFLIELPSKKSFNVLGCFEMELRAIGFLPQAEVFGGDGAMELTGQVKFAQGPGDSKNDQADYHTLLVGLPEKGKLIPRVYFKTLPVNLNIGEAFKLNGVVEFIQTPQEEGFSGEGSLEIQGLPSIAASFSFLRVRQNEQTPWLRAWFIYIEVRKVSFQIPYITLYLREVGLGFGYRYTIASIKAADQTNDLRQLIQSLRSLSRTQGDLSKRDRWSVDLEQPGEDPRWTIALRALLSQTSASASPLEYNQGKEEKLPCLFLFDAVIAFRSDLTFFMAVRGWINTNYDYYLNNRGIQPLFSGFVLLAPRQKRLLAQLSSNPNGFTGNNPPLPPFVNRALKNSQFAATLLIEPGLVHYELGWPNMLRWSDEFGPLKAEIRGGFIFRISKKELVIGSSLLARASLKFSAELDAGFVGARVLAEISVAYGTRYIGVFDFEKPSKGSAFYAAVGLEARIRLRIEFWLQFTIKVLRWRKKIRITYRFSVDIGFTSSLELGIDASAGVGIRGSGTLSLSAMGHNLQLSVKFSVNDNAVSQALERTEKYLQLGLEATDVEPVPGLPAPAVSTNSSQESFQPLSLSADTQEISEINNEATNINNLNDGNDVISNDENNNSSANPSEGFPTAENNPASDELDQENEQSFKVPGYVTFTIRKMVAQKEVCYFLLLPQGEEYPTGKPEKGFLPVPPFVSPIDVIPDDSIDVDHDFIIDFTKKINNLQHFRPNTENQLDNIGGAWESIQDNQYKWSVNWKKEIESIDEYQPTEEEDSLGQSTTIENLTLEDYLVNAFVVSKEVYKDGAKIFDKHSDKTPTQDELSGSQLYLVPKRDPEPLRISVSIEDDRVNNPSQNNYEEAVKGAFEQFRSSPYFKLDQKNEYDRALKSAFETETSIYQREDQSPEEITESQQIIQFRGTIIQDLIVDFKEYVEAQENGDSDKANEIVKKSVAFQMGLVFRIDAPEENNDDSWIPNWLKTVVVDEDKIPKLQQRSAPRQTEPDPEQEGVEIRTFNISDTNFNQNLPQFEQVNQFADANTIAIAWELDWSTPLQNEDKLTPAQRDPDHHLLHYRVRRVAIDAINSGDREVNYTVKPCQVLHRQEGGLLQALLPRFKVVDHFNQETLEEQANIPSTGLTYYYEITPVDMAGNISPNPLTVFATRYPNEPPQVPTDAEFIFEYELEQEDLTATEILNQNQIPQVLKPKHVLLEWTVPKPLKEGPNVPVGRYLLIFRPDQTLPIGSYGVDQQTKGDRQQLLPTSNARKLANDVVIEIKRSEIDSVQLISDTGGFKQGYRFQISMDDNNQSKLIEKKIFPADGKWQPQSWRIFLQAEAFQANEDPDNEDPDNEDPDSENPSSINAPRSALAPVRLLLRAKPPQAETPQNDETKIPIIEEKRPSTLEWLIKPILLPFLPPEDLKDERGNVVDNSEPDADRLAHVPMAQFNKNEDTDNIDRFRFKGNLENIQYQRHPNKLRCLRFIWNQAPSNLENYPLNLHAGFEILELDIDAHTTKTFNKEKELAKVLRSIQEVKLINSNETLFTPGDTLNHNQWEAWYPSTLCRLQLEQPEGNETPLGAWYSWRESYLDWPQWQELESQSEGILTRPTVFHPCLQEIINILEEDYIVDVQTSPPIQANNVQDLLLNSAATSDPYGWGILQKLGLSMTLSLRVPLKGDLISGSDLLEAIQKSIASGTQREYKIFDKYLHVELLFRADKKNALTEKNAEDSSLLGFVQISLRPIPTQYLQYKKLTIDGKAGTTINLIFPKDEDDNSTIISLIDQSDTSSGQVEIDVKSQAVQKTINLPINGIANILLRLEKDLDIGTADQNIKVVIPLKETINGFTQNEFFQQSQKTLILRKNLTNSSDNDGFRKQFAEVLKESGNDEKIAELEVDIQNFAPTNFLSTYFTFSPDQLQESFNEKPSQNQPKPLATQWQRLQRYLQSLNSNDSESEKKITPSDLNENITDILIWSQRFFDYCPDIQTEGQTTEEQLPWLVTAYPRSSSPAYAVPDLQGRITYDHLISDQWAHNYRYYIQPQGRYDLLLKSLKQSLFTETETTSEEEVIEDAIAIRAKLIDPQAGGLDIVLNRTHPIVKPLVLSSTRLDRGESESQDNGDETPEQLVPLKPGQVWEVIIAQHPEQILNERNQTLARQLGYRQIAYSVARSFAYTEWIKQLRMLFPDTSKQFLLPSNYDEPPEIPSTISQSDDPIPKLDYLDLTQDEESLNLDIYQRIGDFQQGALVLQWQALPFYYEHCLRLIAQTTTVVSEVNSIVQKDFEYVAPEPLGVIIRGEKLENWKAPSKPIAFNSDQAITINSRSLQIPLRNFWDSLPVKAQHQWEFEKPANRGDKNSNEHKYGSLPDPDVVYQIVELFSGNIEVQAEIFCFLDPDNPDNPENNQYYEVRQLGRRFLTTFDSLKAPTDPQSDYLLHVGVIQITEETLSATYKQDDLAQPTKSKIFLQSPSDGSTKIYVANKLERKDIDNILAVAENQSGDNFEQDQEILNNLFQSWFNEEAISNAIDSEELPDDINFPTAVNCNLIWDGSIDEEQQEGLLLLDGDEDFILALKRLSRNTPPPRPTNDGLPENLQENLTIEKDVLIWKNTFQNEESNEGLNKEQENNLRKLIADEVFNKAINKLIKLIENNNASEITVELLPIEATTESCPLEILPEDIPESVNSQLTSEPESLELVNNVWQLNWKLTWKGIISDEQQLELENWAVIPEWEEAVTQLLLELDSFVLPAINLPPAPPPRPLNSELVPILRGKLNIQDEQLDWNSDSVDTFDGEEKPALNDLREGNFDNDFKDAIGRLITEIENAIANLETGDTSISVSVTVNRFIVRPTQSDIPDSIAENLTIQPEEIQWRSLLVNQDQLDDLQALSEQGDEPFKQAINTLIETLSNPETITEINTIFVWRRRLLNLIQKISIQLLQKIINQLNSDTEITEEQKTALKELKRKLPRVVLLRNLRDDTQEDLLNQLLEDNENNLDKNDLRILQLTKENLSLEQRRTIGRILQNHLLIGNALIRYHGIMTIEEGESILREYPLPSDRRAIQRLYGQTFNSGLQGRKLEIRTRRGSAKPSDFQSFEVTNLNLNI